MNQYVFRLVTQDLGFGEQLEQHIRKIDLQREMDKNEELLEDDEAMVLEDADYVEFADSQDEDLETDNEMFAKMSEEGMQ